MTDIAPGTRLHRSGRLIPEGLDEALVRRVVDAFYAKARRDPVIGPVFNAARPEADWPRHLSVIADFWASMLLGTGTYSGRPMPKHLALPGLGDAHFERWLSLFKETVDELCPPPVAACHRGATQEGTDWECVTETAELRPASGTVRAIGLAPVPEWAD